MGAAFRARAATLAISLLLGACDGVEQKQESTTEIRAPHAGPPLTIGERYEVEIPGDTELFARSGFELLLIPPGDFHRGTPQRKGPLAVVRDRRMVTLSSQWSDPTGGEPRATLGDPDPFVVLTESTGLGYGTDRVRAMSLGKLLADTPEDAAINLPRGLRSPLVVRMGTRLLATGYTFDDPGGDVVTGKRVWGRRQAENIAIYDVAGEKPRMLALLERFSDHATNNLASAATTDGTLHLLASEVLVSGGNRSRVHHLRFDPRTRAWLDGRILFTRSDFTSSNRPRLVAAANTVDAFWLPEGGADKLASDGLYAHRIGESVTWRLTAAYGEYALLPDADGRGAMLVGVATKPSEERKVQWFLRRGSTWSTAGETDFGVVLYASTIDGTEPFALWRAGSGTVHAAFTTPGKLLIAELNLPE